MQEMVKCRINKSRSVHLPDTKKEQQEQLCLSHSVQISHLQQAFLVVF